MKQGPAKARKIVAPPPSAPPAPQRLEAPAPRAAPGAATHAWTFLTNHSHVLICIAQDPALRLRDVAQRVGITERAVQKIIADLESAGVLTREKQGRRNHYVITAAQPLRHPVESHRTVADLLAMIARRD